MAGCKPVPKGEGGRLVVPMVDLGDGRGIPGGPSGVPGEGM